MAIVVYQLHRVVVYPRAQPIWDDWNTISQGHTANLSLVYRRRARTPYDHDPRGGLTLRWPV